MGDNKLSDEMLAGEEGGKERGEQGVMEYHLIKEEKQYKACVLTFRQCLIYLRFVVFLVSFLYKSIS